MELKLTKLEFADSRSGSALIMVVVLTVLLAVIGVLFVMTARIDEMATSSVVYDRELDYAVESVVELISQRLTDDLDLPPAAAAFDYPGISDRWLSTIEPDSLDNYRWPHVSDITGDIQAAQAAGWIGPFFAGIYSSADANDILSVILSGSDPNLARADADGDGVTDSFWIRLPDITTGRGKPVFAAVRIIDNCGMLNLNTASYIADPNVWPDMEGRYLSSVDYGRFLRGADLLPLNRDAIGYARQGGPRPLPMPPLDPPDVYHRNAIMHIENPGPDYVLFDISDELEIRNRFMLTSLFEARFERSDVANFTLDAGGGIYAVLRIPVDSTMFDRWKWRLDPKNFDDTSGAWVDLGIPVDYRYKYDRRHVCTFYSFDRNLRLALYPGEGYEGDNGYEVVPPILDDAGNTLLMIFDPDPWTVCTRIADWDPAILPAGGYNYNNVETRVQILKLLYAFRAYYLEKYPSEDFKQAARRAAQIVANMIDYVDDNNLLTEGPFFQQIPDFDGDLFDYGSQTNDNPTFINREVIRQLIREVSKHLYGRSSMIDIGDASNINSTPYEFGLGVDDPDETIYGYERQPFISEIARYETAGGRIYYAIELCNPYKLRISLDNWKIKIGAFEYKFLPGDGAFVPARAVAPPRDVGRFVLVDNINILVGGDSRPPNFDVPGFVGINSGDVIELQRPDPAIPDEFITVDKTKAAQATDINSAGRWRVSKRDDTEWKFTNAGSYTTNDNAQTLGRPNAVSPPLAPKGYQMPVADDNVPIGTLGDFEMVLTVGNGKSSDPNALTVTEYVAAASGEGDVRTDVAAGSPYPLDYICFVGRPEGTLPGRINVNTATKEVIRAAIPPDAGVIVDYEALAANIVWRREMIRPLERITDLLDVSGFKQFADPIDPNGVGDPDMRGDFEERDWILSRVANKLTVRSDVFTAYILVRLGHDGPERRMIAIFDRSNVSKPIGNNKPEKPRIIALHPVPDPR